MAASPIEDSIELLGIRRYETLVLGRILLRDPIHLALTSPSLLLAHIQHNTSTIEGFGVVSLRSRLWSNSLTKLYLLHKLSAFRLIVHLFENLVLILSVLPEPAFVPSFS